MVATGSSFGRRLRVLRVARGLSQVGLAKAIGRHQTTIGPYERDEYSPAREIVERLAHVLDTSPEYLLFGRSPQRHTLAIVGRIGPGGLAEVRNLNLMSLNDAQLNGWRVEDDVMLPVFRPGQVALALGIAEPPEVLLGREVLATTTDGRTLLRRLMPGARAEVFDLVAWNGPTLAGVELREARLVVGCLAEEALTHGDEDAKS